MQNEGREECATMIDGCLNDILLQLGKLLMIEVGRAGIEFKNEVRHYACITRICSMVDESAAAEAQSMTTPPYTKKS